MRVSIIGTGYVGLVSGTCFAEMGHTVTCIDLDQSKIEMLKGGQCPIYEPGLTDLLERNTKEKRLSFSTDYDSVTSAKTIFLGVGTPSREDGRADLKYLEAATKSIAPYLSDESIVVIKSTVPVGTHQKVAQILKENTSKKVYVANNPEFLKEGSAVDDFMRPDRVVIGCKEAEAKRALEELYEPLVRQGNPIYSMSNLSAEMTKYAANCFLATKISFINEVARLCDQTGADIDEVRKGMTSDRRIGNHFLYPGIGYGGSCFPKDVKALIATGEDYGVEMNIIRAADRLNEDQKKLLFLKMKKHFKNDLKGKTVAFWGVSFKPNTDDVREAPSLTMANLLIQEGAKIQYYDPIAGPNFQKALSDLSTQTTAFDNKYEVLKNADALCILTEWPTFRVPDFGEVKEKMSGEVIFDGRNLYRASQVKEAGFHYYAIGKKVD